jgi:hypothetical protein
VQAQKQELLKQLSEHGWRIASQEEELDWWADEMWRLQSLWSPVDAVAYVTFLVDPAVSEDRKKGEHVWAVMASSAKPLSRQLVEGEFTASLGHHWKRHLPAFFEHLDALRSQQTTG